MMLMLLACADREPLTLEWHSDEGACDISTGDVYAQAAEFILDEPAPLALVASHCVTEEGSSGSPFGSTSWQECKTAAARMFATEDEALVYVQCEEGSTARIVWAFEHIEQDG